MSKDHVSWHHCQYFQCEAKHQETFDATKWMAQCLPKVPRPQFFTTHYANTQHFMHTQMQEPMPTQPHMKLTLHWRVLSHYKHIKGKANTLADTLNRLPIASLRSRLVPPPMSMTPQFFKIFLQGVVRLSIELPWIQGNSSHLWVQRE